MTEPINNFEIATFGGGCFWCTEAVFNQIKGVHKITSGYSGGTVPGIPTYKEVCSGLTGHAEVIQMRFDPNEISYKELLLIFMTTHDPTTLNRQGEDVGTQYRSVVFYHNDTQKETAQQVFLELAPYFESPVVTELLPAVTFHEAEDYHQNYYANNPAQSYCNAVIPPKLAKLRAFYADKLK